jgi:hypothetical protein
MRAYAAQGRQASALKQFETCRKILTRELGVEPEPETVALYRNIRKQRALAVEGETTTAAMMAAVDRHRKRVPQSQRYYEKKRAEGKRHNQAIRALGRHLRRVIFKMLSQERPYWIDPRSKPQTFFEFPLPNSSGMVDLRNSQPCPECRLLGVDRTKSARKLTSSERKIRKFAFMRLSRKPAETLGFIFRSISGRSDNIMFSDG